MKKIRWLVLLIILINFVFAWDKGYTYSGSCIATSSGTLVNSTDKITNEHNYKLISTTVDGDTQNSFSCVTKNSFTRSLKTYSISYNLNSGSISGQKTSYTIETETFSLPTPTRSGYTFAGWTGSNGSTAQTSVSIAKGSTGNKTYTANWNANGYTIIFNSNGGSGSMFNLSMTYDIAKNLITNSFTRTGYTFKGWNTQANGNGTSYSNSQSVKNLATSGTITLYAQWTINSYTLTFNANGGNVSENSRKVNYGSQYGTLPIPTRNNYTFLGWYTAYSGGTQISASTTMNASNVTVFAQWKVNWVHHTDNWTLRNDFSGGSAEGAFNTDIDLGKNVKISSGWFRLRTAGGTDYGYKVYFLVNGSWIEVASGRMSDNNTRTFGNVNYITNKIRIYIDGSNGGVMRYPTDIHITDYYTQ